MQTCIRESAQTRLLARRSMSLTALVQVNERGRPARARTPVEAPPPRSLTESNRESTHRVGLVPPIHLDVLTTASDSARVRLPPGVSFIPCHLDILDGKYKIDMRASSYICTSASTMLDGRRSRAYLAPVSPRECATAPSAKANVVRRNTSTLRITRRSLDKRYPCRALYDLIGILATPAVARLCGAARRADRFTPAACVVCFEVRCIQGCRICHAREALLSR